MINSNGGTMKSIKTSLISRIDTYVKQINNGIHTPNEGRFMEGRKPLVDIGDTLFIPINLISNNNETIKAKTIENGIIGDNLK